MHIGAVLQTTHAEPYEDVTLESQYLTSQIEMSRFGVCLEFGVKASELVWRS